MKVDGKPLQKNQEMKLGVGMTISYGSNEYKVRSLITCHLRISHATPCSLTVQVHPLHGLGAPNEHGCYWHAVKEPYA